MVSEKLVLKRKLNVEFFECIATIRRQEKTAYITSVLKLAKRYGKITADKLMDELLPEESLALSENILKRHAQLGFIDESGRPTELGEEAARGNVFMPERGKYVIGVTTDPLVGNRPVYVNRADDGDKPKNSHGGSMEKPKGIRMPEIIARVTGKRSLVWLDGEIKEILVESIDDIVHPKTNDVSFHLQLEIDKDSTRLSIGRNNSDPIITSNDVEIDFEEIWDLHVKTLRLRWLGKPLNMGKGLVEYGQTNLPERKSFTKNLPSQAISTSSYGSFTVEPVSIYIRPATTRDAMPWARDLIRSEIIEFCDERKYKEISERVRGRFTDLVPEIPDIDEFIEYLYGLAENASENLPIEYWYLRAPRDLKVEVV